MPLNRDNIIMIVAAVIMTVLQAMLAPYIAIQYAMPNFMAAYAVAVSVVRPNSTRMVILSFAMGVLYNLLFGGPLGAMAVALIFVCLIAGKLMTMMSGETSVVPLGIVVIGLLATHLIYGFLVSIGTGLSPLDSMLLRAIPCFAYDAVVGLILYFIMSRLAAEPDKSSPIGGPTLLR